MAESCRFTMATSIGDTGGVSVWLSNLITMSSLVVSVLALGVSCLARDSAKVAADAARRVADIEGNRRHDECGPREVKLAKVLLEPSAHVTGKLDAFGVLENPTGRTYTYGGTGFLSGAQAPLASGDLLAGGQSKVYLGHHGAVYDRIELWFAGDCWCAQPSDRQPHWKRMFAVPGPSDVLV